MIFYFFWENSIKIIFKIVSFHLGSFNQELSNCLVWTLNFSTDTSKAACWRWLCLGFLSGSTHFPSESQISHFLHSGGLCWPGHWARAAHSVHSSEKRSPGPFSPLPADVQGKQRTLSCFISLSHIPNNTQPQKSPETPSSSVFQSLICPFFSTWHKSPKNPV